MTKILHVVPCVDEASGVFRVARLLADRQRDAGAQASVLTVRAFNSLNFDFAVATGLDEIWVHGMWLPSEWRAMRKVIRAQSLARTARPRAPIPRLVRMTHGSLSPVYLERQSKWKKRIAAWLWERRYFRLCDRVVVTCAAEAEWCRAWGVKNEIEQVDLKAFFRLDCTTPDVGTHSVRDGDRALHVMYLGRPHPLKGVSFLARAATDPAVELRIVCDHFGEELERDWAWCDVLCLPTLSENFGLVVAEALERGKRVITTDGAPAWALEEEAKGRGGEWRSRLLYLRGFRDGTDEMRVKLLKDALLKAAGGSR